MARPLEFNKAEALAKATDIFWTKGFEAASLQDLIAGMNLSKSSFYQVFQSKGEIYLAALEQYSQWLPARLASNLQNSPSAFKFIEKTFLDVACNADADAIRKGCFLMNATTEFAQTNPEVSALIQSGFVSLRKIFAKAVRQAQSEGDIPSDKNSNQLADFILCNINGLRTLTQGGVSKSQLKSLIGVILSTLKK